MIDPVTFEVLRHRIATIVQEGAAVLRTISGSPSIAQSNDCNVALLSAGGEGVVIGRSIASHAISCIRTAKYVMSEYAENPGIHPDDMFFTNHPYIGTPHQTCGAMVAPIFAEGRVVAWSGVGIHFGDVGGVVPGQVSIGAQSIWSEAIPMPPIKMVEGGVLRRDIEEDFLIRSRTRSQNAVDLKATIGANNAVKSRITTLIRRYGVKTFSDALEQTVSVAERKLRAIMREIPDGSWSAENYIDYYDRGKVEVYVCRLTLTKEGEELTFDFSGSSQQAPAVINATFGTMEGYLVRSILGIFGFAVSYCPAAIQRILHIKSTPGTVVNCTWPAGISKGTTSVTHSIWHTAVKCLSEMLLGSEQYADRSIAVSRGHLLLLDLQGNDQYGSPFAAVISDGALSTGSGANRDKDGIDSGGGAEPEVSIPNVESNESRYPILYLYRRQCIDSGGPGRRRGGVGINLAFVPHDVPEIANVMIHSHGVTFPSAVGVAGGYPGMMNSLAIERETNVESLFGSGVLPDDARQAQAREHETPPPFSYTQLRAGDVFACVGGGGGGFGDPLERSPDLVRRDVERGLVSGSGARDQYGVSIDERTLTIDAAQTTKQRASLLEARRGASVSQAPGRLASAHKCSKVAAGEAARFNIRESTRRAEPFGGSGADQLPSYTVREVFCGSCSSVVDVTIHVGETIPAP